MPIGAIGKPNKMLENTWLGPGYYFWTEEDFAHYWGEDCKIENTGSCDIYRAHLDCRKCINTVFDEQAYLFFKDMIVEAVADFKNKRRKVTLDAVTRFLVDEVWITLDVEGIIYDDRPTNPKKKPRIYSEVPNLYYRKRIQIVLFNSENITNFALHLGDQK